MKSITIFLCLTLTSYAGFRQEKSEASLKVYHNDTLITEYLTDSQVPYLYPLVAPSGQSLTRHFPMKKGVAGEQSDHPHHRSFWFCHGNVNGHDFWHSKDGKTKINHKSFLSAKDDAFTAQLAWQHGDKTLLDEKRTYQFSHPTPTSLLIEVTSTLTAATQVTFGDTKEGSFAIRVCPTMRHEGKVAKGNILNSEKQTDKKAWGKRARWVSYQGPDPAGKPASVTMMDHPSNHNHPTHWHARTYGLLTANPFGEKSFTKKGNGTHILEKGKSLTQKYAVLLTSREITAEDIEKTYKSFSSK
ncbi:MAG: PmoA family protein [Akkermansiaceae bacterium]